MRTFTKPRVAQAAIVRPTTDALGREEGQTCHQQGCSASRQRERSHRGHVIRNTRTALRPRADVLDVRTVNGL